GRRGRRCAHRLHAEAQKEQGHDHHRVASAGNNRGCRQDTPLDGGRCGDFRAAGGSAVPLEPARGNPGGGAQCGALGESVEIMIRDNVRDLVPGRGEPIPAAPAPASASSVLPAVPGSTPPDDSLRKYAIWGWVILILFFGGFGGWAMTAPLNGA